MGLDSLSKPHYHFVCTNYGSSKDGIGHYTSKIVNELNKKGDFNVSVYEASTDNLAKFRLFLSIRMSLVLLNVMRTIKKSLHENYIILEYPFVEYNPLFLFVLALIKIKKNSRTKIVISLHEYSRTKLFRKLFIKLLIPLGDIILFTKKEDVEPFLNKGVILKKRIIPANIEPLCRKRIAPTEIINICFFGIVNFETKAIDNMLKGWEWFCEKHLKSKIQFHFISSTFNDKINEAKNITCHFGLNDQDVSIILHKMQFMILPLKPQISINNGSLSVSCIHECVPVGVFDTDFFNLNFGLAMDNYSIEAFIQAYEKINNFEYDVLKEKSNTVFEYGRKNSAALAAQYYYNLVE